ncbi:hypothetical protein ABW20_dc0110512 [Dactylellina cionopaga]|nr:hypothetical protein ABW20_dc0110512 [Dactylellina cionopaga]
MGIPLDESQKDYLATEFEELAAAGTDADNFSEESVSEDEATLYFESDVDGGGNMDEISNLWEKIGIMGLNQRVTDAGVAYKTIAIMSDHIQGTIFRLSNHGIFTTHHRRDQVLSAKPHIFGDNVLDDNRAELDKDWVPNIDIKALLESAPLCEFAVQYGELRRLLDLDPTTLTDKGISTRIKNLAGTIMEGSCNHTQYDCLACLIYALWVMQKEYRDR